MQLYIDCSAQRITERNLMRNKFSKRSLVLLLFIFSLLIALNSCSSYYVVTFDSDGGSHVASVEVEEGTLVTMPEQPTKEGYTFLGWYKDNDKWDFSHYVVTGNITLKASWQINYTATFDSNGGSEVPSVTKISGSLVERPADPTLDGHTFLGWYNGDVLWSFENDTLQSNVTLTAKWVINRTASFDPAGASPIESQTVTNGSHITEPPTPILDGHTFLGWFINDIPWNFATDILTDNVTLVAKWGVNRLVTFDSNGGTEIPSIVVADGTKLVPPPQPTITDYAFVGWYYGDTPWDFENGIVTSDIILTARWESNYFVVSFNSDGAEEVPKQNVTMNGYAVEPPTPVKEGHIFIGWFLEDIPWNFTLNKVPANIVLTAKWIKNITVSFDSDGGTPVADQKLTAGAFISVPAAPIKDGYAFAGWYLGDTAWDFETNTATDTITLVAKWVAVYTVTFNSDGGSNVALQKVTAGSAIAPPITPEKENYVFRYWECNGRIWDFETDTVNENITLRAVYYAPVSVTFDSQGGTSVEPLLIVYGNTIPEPQPITKDNYVFSGWYLGEQLWDFTSPLYESITLRAEWTIMSYTVSFDSNGGTALDPIKIEPNTLIDYYSLETPTREGYTFVGWFCPAINNYWNFDEDLVSSDITLIAQWREGNGMNNGVLGPSHDWGSGS